MQLLERATLGCASDEAVELAREGAAQGTAVRALVQTSGKGRHGHRWLNTDGGLYLAIVLRPQVPMQYLMGLTAVCGLGALDALRAAGARDVALGWPNDVLVSRGGGLVPGEGPVAPQLGKLGNIVIDAGAGEGGVFAVCGVNFNLGSAPSLDEVKEPGDFEAMNPLVPAALSGCDATAEQLAPALVDAVVARVDAWSADVRSRRAMAGPLAPVLSEYFDEVPLLGQRVRASYPDGRVAAEGFLVAL